MDQNTFTEKQSGENLPIKESIEVISQEKENGEKEKNLTREEIKELREKIEQADLDDSLTTQAESHANDLNSLKEEQKLKKLLEIAKEKGIIFVVGVVKKMDDPYLLDILHDRLVREGYYKEFKT